MEGGILFLTVQSLKTLTSGLVGGVDEHKCATFELCVCVCGVSLCSLECRTCVVIGNGFAIKNSSLGSIINKYDVVIR